MPFVPGPVLDGHEEGPQDPLVLVGVQIPEPGRLLVAVFVEAVVDDAHDPAGRLSVLHGKEEDRVAVTEGLVLFPVEVLPIVHVNGVDPAVVTGVDPLRQVDEGLEVLAGPDLPDLDGHGSALSSGIRFFYPIFQAKKQSISSLGTPC
jgi:hypothetical protein